MSNDASADPTPPRRPRSTGPVQYRGADLEPARGPGLGCFRFQLAVLAVFVVLTPLSVGWRWPSLVSAGLLFAVIILLLVTGQTIIFLLRLVAADRRGRRRPLASDTQTVGELEDAAGSAEDDEARRADDAAPAGASLSAAPPNGPADASRGAVADDAVAPPNGPADASRGAVADDAGADHAVADNAAADHAAERGGPVQQ